MHLELENIKTDCQDISGDSISVLTTDQLCVNVEVDGVAGLVAPGRRVQGGADVELVTEGLAHSPPHHQP